MLQIISLVLLCTERESPQLPQTAKHTAYQRKLMHSVIREHTGQYEDIMRYFCPEKYQKRDVCYWSGVQCTDGRVTTFVCISPLNLQWTLDVDYLPPSLRYLHFSSIQSFPYSCDVLPRDLRYFFMLSCPVLSRPLEEKSFDFRRLPENIEEFHNLFSWIAGTVIIDKLPRSLRILNLQSKELEEAYIGSAPLPTGLWEIVVQNGPGSWSAQNVTVVAEEGSAMQRVVQTGIEIDFFDSLYFLKMSSMVEALEFVTRNFEI